MGYRSQVTIQCEEKAFEMFKKAWEAVDFKPNHIWESGEDGNFLYTFQWDWVKWCDYYDDVSAIEEVMNNLEDKHDNETGYAFAFILIGEDNATEERRSERAYDMCEDFYVQTTVNLPNDVRSIA